VYVTRDSEDDKIWVWRKPSKGNWAPSNVCAGEGMTNWQRPDRNLEGTSYYLATDFKKKFGITIREKTKKCVHLPVSLLDSEEYMLATPLENLNGNRCSGKRKKRTSKEENDELDFE